jgi:hypothetical protein
MEHEQRIDELEDKLKEAERRNASFARNATPSAR